MTSEKHLLADTVHVVIPDTQAKYGVPTAHLGWVGRYINEKFRGRPKVRVIHVGDHWDMPSLSSYDTKGGKLMEGRRYTTDVRYGNEAWDILTKAILKGGDWVPDLHFLHGNHEERIVRAVEQDAQLDGLIDLDQLAVNKPGDPWKAHPFLKPVRLDGITYAHYFQAQNTGKPLSGQSIDARIKTIGHSFTQGHTPGLWSGRRETLHGAHWGLVAGSCYLHDEDFRGYQGNKHWRGIIVKYDVRNGDYDPKFVSLDSLCKRYEGKRLSTFLGRH